MDEKDDGSQVELDQGQDLVVTLRSNPSTGYRWEVVEIDESILGQIGEAQYTPSDPRKSPLPGQGGTETFRFKVIGLGRTALRLAYQRPWEKGAEPLKTYSLQVEVR